MANATRTTGTYTAHTNASAADIEADISALYTAHNNHDSGTSKWTVVSALNASATPLIADNSTGTNAIAEFKDNGSTILTVADGGTVTFAPGGTTKAAVSSSGLTMSNSATIAMGAAKITGLANGTASTDAAAYGQIKYLAAPVQGTTSSSTSTSSSSFQATNLTASITPSSSSSRIKVSVSGMMLVTSASTTGQVTLYRDSTNLGGSNGFASHRPGSTASANSRVPVSFNYIDSPATTSSTTYTVRVLSTDGSNTVTFAELGTAVIILEEVA